MSNKNEIKKFYTSSISHLRKSEFIKQIGEGPISKIYLYKCNCIHESQFLLCNKNKQICNKVFVVKKISNDRSLKRMNIFNFFKNKKIRFNSYEFNTRDSRTSECHSIDTYNELEYNIKKVLMNEYVMGIKLNGFKYIRNTLDIDLINNCIIFEDCPGDDFFEYLNKNPELNFDMKLCYFKQLMEALLFIHQNNIAHRDLKLENIIIEENNKRIKIIDFADAVESNNHDKKYLNNTKFGTMEYLPPEIFYNSYYNPYKVDIWCCGIILYELVYNSIPWTSCKKTFNNNKFKYYQDSYDENDLNIFRKPIYFSCETLDFNIISKILLEMLNPCMEKRINIFDLQNLISKL